MIVKSDLARVYGLYFYIYINYSGMKEIVCKLNVNNILRPNMGIEKKTKQSETCPIRETLLNDAYHYV